MGILVNKDEDQNSRLTERINADLRRKTAAAKDEGEEIDLAEDSEYLKNYQKTGRFSWFWPVLIILAIISLISIFLF